jgi:hypothetical protein
MQEIIDIEVRHGVPDSEVVGEGGVYVGRCTVNKGVRLTYCTEEERVLVFATPYAT